VSDVPLDPRAGSPSRKIAARLRASILRGDYAPGDRLPSVRELAGREGVNPNTIQRAYEILDAEGWTQVRAGAGTFVSTVSRLPAPRRRALLRAELASARRAARRVGAEESEWREEERRVREEILL